MRRFGLSATAYIVENGTYQRSGLYVELEGLDGGGCVACVFGLVGFDGLDCIRFLFSVYSDFVRIGECLGHTVAVAMMFSYRWRSWEMLVLMRSAIVSLFALRILVY